MAINIQEILHPSDSDSIKFEKINYNFDQILANGGGPIGPKGQKGDQGQVGSTGQKGQKGDIGPIGLKGVSGATDSPWYKVNVDSNNDGINEVSILKPKIGNDLNMPIIWLGDDDFVEDVTNGDVSTNARLTIAKDAIFENYIKLYHAIDKALVMTSTADGIFSKFNWQNAFGSSNIEFGATTDKITFLANNYAFSASGVGMNLKSIGNTNIKFSSTGFGILDVDMNAEFKGYLRLPAGTTGQRHSVPQLGMIRFNTDLDIVEAYYNNGGTPEWRELCTDCGTPVGDSIGISGGDINANADGSPLTDTIDIVGGDINANTDGSPISSATLAAVGSTSLTAQYNSPTTLYLNYTIAPTSSDPGSSNISVNTPGLTITPEPANNRIKVVTSVDIIGKTWQVTVRHPLDTNVMVVWTVSLVNVSVPTATPVVPTATPITPTATPSTDTAVINNIVDVSGSIDTVSVSFTLSDNVNCNAITLQHSSNPSGPWTSDSGICTSPRTRTITGGCGNQYFFRIVQSRSGLPDVISSVYPFTLAACLAPLTFTLYSSVEGSFATGRSYTWDLSGYPQTGHTINMGIYGKNQVYTITGTSGYDLSYDVVGAAYAAFLNGLTTTNWIGGTSYTYTQNNPKGFEPTASYDAVNNRLTFNMNWQNSIGLPYVNTTPSPTSLPTPTATPSGGGGGGGIVSSSGSGSGMTG